MDTDRGAEEFRQYYKAERKYRYEYVVVLYRQHTGDIMIASRHVIHH